MSDATTGEEPEKTPTKRPSAGSPAVGQDTAAEPASAQQGAPKESRTKLLVRIWLAISIAAPLFGSGYLLGYDHGRSHRPPPTPAVVTLKSPRRPPAAAPAEEAPKAPADKLIGLVVDEAGAPVAQANVSFVGAPNTPDKDPGAVGELGVTSGPVPTIPQTGVLPTQGASAVQSDSAGRFELPRPGAPAHLLVARPGFVSAVVAVQPGEPAPLRVMLPTGGSVEGTVVDERGLPRSGVYLIARGENSMSATAQTDASGHYVLNDVLGDLTVEAFIEGQLPQSCKAVVKAKATDTCDFQLEAAPEVIAADPNLGSISGYVLDSLGRPVPRANVETDEGDAAGVTDEAGEFTLINIAPGALVINADEDTAGSGTSKVVRARAGETLADVRIYLPGRYRGKIQVSTSEAVGRRRDGPASVSKNMALELRGDHVVVAMTANDMPGLKVGDVLETIDDEPVLAVAQARGMLRYPADAVANVKVRRGGTSVIVRFKRSGVK